jgi:uncharacterized protein YdeI (YjbR/CyaY-like superfamily)
LSEDNPRYFKSSEEWNHWLTQNHKNEEVIWVIIQKKGSKKIGIRYDEAVMEAVAHGWIDGKMKRLNEYEFMQRFTPRRPNSIWSLTNKKRAQKLIIENRMTPAGLKKIEEAKKNGRWEKAQSSRKGAAKVPDDLLKALENNNTAYKNFQAFPDSVRYMYIRWVNEAKRISTRKRRIYTVVDRSEKNQRAGISFRVSKKE